MADIDAGYVNGLYTWAIRQPQERDLRTFIREVRELYDMKRAVRIPKEYKKIAQEIRTPFLRDIALRITASLTKEPAVYLVEARDENADTEKAAAIAGRWLGGITTDMTRLAPEDVQYKAALSLIRDSENTIKVVDRPQAWANFPERDGDEDPKKYLTRAQKYARGSVVNPYAWREVDRLQMVYGDGEYGDEWAIEYGEYATPYAAVGSKPDPENPTPETTLAGPPTYETSARGVSPKTVKLEYFDATNWAVVVNGKMAPGFPKDNPYAPYLPYIRAVSPPTLYPLRYLVPALDSLLTMKHNWAYLSAFPIVVIEALAQVQQMLNELPTGDTSEPNYNVRAWHPGEGWFPPPGYTMRFLAPPDTGRDLDGMIQEVREMIDIVGIPSVFRGQGGSRQAGYSINQLMQASQMTYKKSVEALQRQQENVARFLFNCVDKKGHTVYVLGKEGDQKKFVGLKPSGTLQVDVAPVDVLGPPRVTFRPVLPTDEQAMAMIALQEINAPRPLVSHEYALEHYLQIADPQAMVDDIAAERLLESPQVSMKVIEAAYRKAGLPTTPTTPLPQNGQIQPVNDAANAGEPTVPGLTQSLQPARPQTETIGPGTGGRPSGAYPGLPSGQGGP